MSRSGMRVRSADSCDIESIRSIAKSGSVPWGIESIQAGFENPNSILVVEDRAGDISGFIAILIVAGELQILNLAVSPDFRNRGLATLLMRSAAVIASRKGAESCNLEVDAVNQPALSLYKKLGFRKTGRRPKFYSNGDDAIMMQAHIKNILERSLPHSG